MVRIWHVPPAYLDEKRLLGEHLEIHVIINAINKVYEGKKGGYTNHPETKKYVKKVKFLLKRHNAQIREMKKRGWKAGKIHETPLNISLIPKSAMKDYRPTKAMIKKDILDLKKRWKREGKRGGRKKISDIKLSQSFEKTYKP